MNASFQEYSRSHVKWVCYRLGHVDGCAYSQIIIYEHQPYCTYMYNQMW